MNYDYLFKLLFIGDQTVGKTSFCHRLSDNHYNNNYVHTIGIEFSTCYTKIKDDRLIKFQMWDTSGRKEYLPLVQSYYKGVVGIILMYSVDDEISFKRVDFWLNEINKHKKDDEEVNIFLIGNKIDTTNRVISYEDGKEKARQHNIHFFETSVKNNIDCHNIKKSICNIIFENYDPEIGHTGVKLPIYLDLEKRKECEDFNDCCCCV
jgi:small GTP-binding protein